MDEDLEAGMELELERSPRGLIVGSRAGKQLSRRSVGATVDDGSGSWLENRPMRMTVGEESWI